MEGCGEACLAVLPDVSVGTTCMLTRVRLAWVQDGDAAGRILAESQNYMLVDGITGGGLDCCGRECRRYFCGARTIWTNTWLILPSLHDQDQTVSVLPVCFEVLAALHRMESWIAKLLSNMMHSALQ